MQVAVNEVFQEVPRDLGVVLDQGPDPGNYKIVHFFLNTDKFLKFPFTFRSVRDDEAEEAHSDEDVEPEEEPEGTIYRLTTILT